jgi:hypothetical protein
MVLGSVTGTGESGQGKPESEKVVVRVRKDLPEKVT